ncbi:MAG: bifunctional diaminohydroxyphosphoribosylaminopyrimidine deaminase/5-amino-6-(5-phosphoribosylamino)uracil reductase RibD [Vulcanimicrobiaceae bacterium]
MEGRRGHTVTQTLSPLDRIYLRRACELAARGRGGTSPNPAVGAVIADGGRTLGEGFHRIRGGPHAEVEALRDAESRGNDVRGATIYVTLEPCDHVGSTPPCSLAVRDAGLARVVVGALDPNARTAEAGVARLRASGIAVSVADDPWSRDLIEEFAIAVNRLRPYVRLKLAASLDGYVAPRSGERHWLTGREARGYVRELRATHDAVLVGAGTVRVDDPALSVRPPRARAKPYLRAIACETAPVPCERAIFAPLPGYDTTVVLAPAGERTAFASLETTADVAYVGADDARTLDLGLALATLRGRGIASVLCEGGPTLGGHLLAAGLVDRIDWLVAPALLASGEAVRALGGETRGAKLTFDRVERLGPDVLLSARVARERNACSAD